MFTIQLGKRGVGTLFTLQWVAVVKKKILPVWVLREFTGNGFQQNFKTTSYSPLSNSPTSQTHWKSRLLLPSLSVYPALEKAHLYPSKFFLFSRTRQFGWSDQEPTQTEKKNSMGLPGLLQGRRSDGHSSKNVASRIPKFTFDPERVSDARRCHGDYIRTNFAEDKLYGYRRIPTPMPRGKAPPGGDMRR
ncbi:hypothetical protein CDAR_112511 [Caerostris darwini]|uniref:Uncharacterized protein n=1 Tax=Caerostris darwini TaxID=1538125 RepID=A0AAV4PXC9_9ARAC|nr:hypothetical protein CDAR_112511 [Caerostris darwini]